MRNNKQHSSHSHHNNGNMDHSKHDHNEMDHSKMNHSAMDHSEMDHGAMGGHAHHHHGSFKDIFLKSLPLGIAILLITPLMGCIGNNSIHFWRKTIPHGCER